MTRDALMTQLRIADNYLLAGSFAYGGELRAAALRELNALNGGNGAGTGGLSGTDPVAGTSRKPANGGRP